MKRILYCASVIDTFFDPKSSTFNIEILLDKESALDIQQAVARDNLKLSALQLPEGEDIDMHECYEIFLCASADVTLFVIPRKKFLTYFDQLEVINKEVASPYLLCRNTNNDTSSSKPYFIKLPIKLVGVRVVAADYNAMRFVEVIDDPVESAIQQMIDEALRTKNKRNN